MKDIDFITTIRVLAQEIQTLEYRIEQLREENAKLRGERE